MLTRRELVTSVAAIPALLSSAEVAKSFHAVSVRGGMIVDSFNFPADAIARASEKARISVAEFAAAFQSYQSRVERHDLRESLKPQA